MALYDSKILRSRDFMGAVEKTIKMVRKDKKTKISIEDVVDIVKGLQKSAADKGDNVRILVRGMTIDGMKTLKGYNSEVMVEQFEDYYRNIVHDSTKFKYMSQLELTIEREI